MTTGNDTVLDARGLALDALTQILRRRVALDDCLDLDRLEDSRDRAFAKAMVVTALRRKGQIDAVLARCLEKTPPPAIEDLLRLAVAQLIFLDVPPHAVVDQSVGKARAIGFAPLAGLVNAVLRRIGSEGREWLKPVDPARINTPDWLWQSWCAAYGEGGARDIALSHLNEPPLDLTPLGSAELWAERLEAERLFTGSLRRPAGGAIGALPGYEQGAWWVQDAAATLPVRLLAPHPGDHIADLCAAPGGKTAQLAAAGALVTALDRSARRLQRLSENLTRLKLTAELVAADAAAWTPSKPFDKVLLDAPCSATGTLRRHPDVAWIKQPADIVKLAAAQDKLLVAAATLLRPGGTLVYCTCSLQPEEGSARIAGFLAARPDFRRIPLREDEVGGLAEMIDPAGDLRTLPCHLAEIGGMDGFFAARLQRLGD